MENEESTNSFGFMNEIFTRTGKETIKIIQYVGEGSEIMNVIEMPIPMVRSFCQTIMSRAYPDEMPLTGAERQKAYRDRKKESSSQKYPDSFADFWKAYPRKVGKEAARKAWLKIDPDLQTIELIADALRWQVNSSTWKEDGGKFIPHPSTYLNGKRWLDSKETEMNFESEKDRKRRELIEAIHGKKTGETNDIIDITPTSSYFLG